MRKILIIMLLTLVSIFFIGCSNTNNDTDEGVNNNINVERVPLIISAAISLTDALEEIKIVYEEKNNVDITFNLGGSGSLAQQIQQGAPADIFISANLKWMDTLEEENLILTETRTNITGNKLVLIAGRDTALTYESFSDIVADDIDTIAIGNPESVPAGKYAEEALKSLKVWNNIEEQLVFAKDVRQVLTYVETGNADIGFVYESDALQSDDILILASAEKQSHEPIVYPGAVTTDTKAVQEATDFVAFMATDQAQDILKKYGFTK